MGTFMKEHRGSTLLNQISVIEAKVGGKEVDTISMDLSTESLALKMCQYAFSCEHGNTQIKMT